MFNRFSQTAAAAFLAIGASAICCNANATIVQFQTSAGDFEVNLYDIDTPKTVDNFLAYIEQGSYQNSIVHRSVAGFVVQGGGFTYSDSTLASVPTDAPVINEPKYSNVRATIAMAKIGGNPDSATSQWFINLSNNSGTLDGQNGGFTVFGEVMLDGMDIVDAIAATPVYSISPFQALPLVNYDSTSGTAPDQSNFIMINNIVVIDATVDTADDTKPPLITTKKKKKGGAVGLLALLAMITFATMAKMNNRFKIR